MALNPPIGSVCEEIRYPSGVTTETAEADTWIDRFIDRRVKEEEERKERKKKGEKEPGALFNSSPA